MGTTENASEPEPTPSDSAPAPRFYPIDALRGVAALAVLAFHLFRNSPQTEVLAGIVPGPLAALLDFARSGVAIFFVISGFVIAYTTRNLEGTVSEGLRFSLRRQIRLDPPYYVVIAVVVAKDLVESRVPGLVSQPVTPVQLVANLLYLQDLTHQPALLSVAWTLCLEVQFYLFVIVLTVAAGRLSRIAHRRHVVVGGALAAGALSLALPFTSWDTGGWFIGAWWLFGLGMCVCWFMLGRIGPVTMTLVLVAVAGATLARDLLSARYDPWGGDWVAWGTGILLVGLVLSRSIQARPPRWLLWFGTISYSLYLVHLLVIDTVMAAMFKVLGSSPSGAVLAVVAGFIGSVVAGFVLQRYVERPAQRWSHHLAIRHGRAAEQSRR